MIRVNLESIIEKDPPKQLPFPRDSEVLAHNLKTMNGSEKCPGLPS